VPTSYKHVPTSYKHVPTSYRHVFSSYKHVLSSYKYVLSNIGHQNSGNVLEMMQVSLSICFTFILREFAFLVALPHNLSKIKFYF
jgi:hypothetical protein